MEGTTLFVYNTLCCGTGTGDVTVRNTGTLGGALGSPFWRRLHRLRGAGKSGE